MKPMVLFKFIMVPLVILQLSKGWDFIIALRIINACIFER